MISSCGLNPLGILASNQLESKADFCALSDYLKPTDIRNKAASGFLAIAS
jgi:hypothetical protein